MASCFALHSYKADMGTITISTNLPVLLSKKSIVYFYLTRMCWMCMYHLFKYVLIGTKKLLSGIVQVGDAAMDLSPVTDKYHDITKLIIMEIISQLIQALEFLRSNKVAEYSDQTGIYNESGFATPEAFVLPLTSNHVDNLGSNIITQQREEYDVRTVLSSKIGMEMNSFIIYFCGIQFNQKGILESSFPNHLFEKGFYIK
jgi:hypothetical protein